MKLCRTAEASHAIKKLCVVLILCLFFPFSTGPIDMQFPLTLGYLDYALGIKSRSLLKSCINVCVYSNSRNDVPRVAQRYGTIATHTRRHASVLVVFVVFCMHMHSFAGLIRRMPPPTFSDPAITDRHSDTTIFQLRAHWMRISWSIGSEKSFGHVPPVGVEPSTPCVQGEHPIH